MSVSTRNPIRLAGAQVYSGAPNTGEQQHVRGGAITACVWSGSLLTVAAFGGVAGAVVSGGHVQIWSGAGRLNSILPHVQMSSGVPLFLYDATAITVSGVSVSGQKIVGFVPTTWTGGQLGSGAINTGSPWNGEPVRPDMPFLSGLCAAVPSGVPGFTISFTPEVAPSVG